MGKDNRGEIAYLYVVNIVFIVLLITFFVGLVRFEFTRYLGIDGDKGSVVTLVSFISIPVYILLNMISMSKYRTDTLENNMQELNHTIAEIGANIDAKIDKIDAKFDAKIDKIDAKFDVKIEKISELFSSKLADHSEKNDAKFDAKIDRIAKLFSDKLMDHSEKIAKFRS